MIMIILSVGEYLLRVEISQFRNLKKIYIKLKKNKGVA